MSSRQLRIAIIGAGPAGLTLGVLLHKHNIPFTIFERSQKPADEDYDKPAGSLDLHEETGLAALKAAGLFDEFNKHIGDCTEASVVSDKNGNILYRDEGESRSRPEISRLKLTKLLLDTLPASAIQWNRKLLSAQRLTKTESRNEIELDFGENGKQIVDLVVGADGAWSKVRKLLTNVMPLYAGIQNITANIRQISTRYPHLSDFVGTGTFSALGDHHGVMSQRAIQDTLRIYIMITTPDEHFAAIYGFENKPTSEVKPKLLDNEHALFRKWSASIKDLVIAACDDESMCNKPGEKIDIKPLYMLPVGQTWSHQIGATLIGDAAHLMCPWAGEGVNLAMKDSLLLSQAIAKAYELSEKGEEGMPVHKTLDSLVNEFEVEMLTAAKVEAEGTVENGKMMFGSVNGAQALAEFFRSAAGPPTLQMD